MPMGKRKLKFYEETGARTPIPKIVLTGKWLEETGLPTGTILNMNYQPDKIIITKEEGKQP